MLFGGRLSYVSLQRGIIQAWPQLFAEPDRFGGVPRFYLDVLDGDQVIQDLEGMEFADREAAIAEAAAGARDLVAHGIMANEDVSGQSFIMRDSHGETVAILPFRATLPGSLGG